MLKKPGTTTFKERFTKLDTIKALLVTIIVKSEKMKVSSHPKIFLFPLPVLVSLTVFFF